MIRPYLSIICATYNRAGLLPRAIDSVINQTFNNWELIIVDDGSIDDTDRVVKRYLKDQRVCYLKQDINGGVGKARNCGVDIAKGDWVILLDSDNALLLDALEKVSKAISKYPNIKMHKFAVLSFDGEPMGTPLECNQIMTSADFIKVRFKGEFHSATSRNLLSKIPFIESVNGGEGIIWKLIALEIGSVAYHPDVTEYYDNSTQGRLSIRFNNYLRLRDVYTLECKYLWRSYIRLAPLQIIKSVSKCLIYVVLSMISVKK